jgi:hypothetical protein
MTENRVRLHAGPISTVFGLVILALAIAHLVMQSVRYHHGHQEFYGLVRLFDMGVEANLPTFFAAFQLLIVSALLAAIGLSRRQAKDRFARHWLFLALIFFLLAADEMSGMHEMSIRPIRDMAPWLVTGFFYWAWVIPAAVLVAVVAVTYARFVFRYLPAATRTTTLIGAALFVGGAIGVEMPEARHVQQHGLDNFTYAVFVLIEETLEKAGILVFLSGLLRYFSSHVGMVALEMVPAAVATTVAKPPPRLAGARRAAL